MPKRARRFRPAHLYRWSELPDGRKLKQSQTYQQRRPLGSPVSQLRRQLVHVNRKVDVLDQPSNEYGPLSALTVRQVTTVLKLSRMIGSATKKAPLKTMRSDPVSDVQIRSSVRSVRSEIGFGRPVP